MWSVVAHKRRRSPGGRAWSDSRGRWVRRPCGWPQTPAGRGVRSPDRSCKALAASINEVNPIVRRGRFRADLRVSTSCGHRFRADSRCLCMLWRRPSLPSIPVPRRSGRPDRTRPLTGSKRCSARRRTCSSGSIPAHRSTRSATSSLEPPASGRVQPMRRVSQGPRDGSLRRPRDRARAPGRRRADPSPRMRTAADRLTQEVLTTRKPVLVRNAQDDPRTVHRWVMRAWRIHSILGVPMIVDEDVIGVLHPDSRRAALVPPDRQAGVHVGSSCRVRDPPGTTRRATAREHEHDRETERVAAP